MIILNWDMDGVLCDFGKFAPGDFEKSQFRRLVMEEKIFENLDLMPNIAEFQESVLVYLEENDITTAATQIITSLGAPGDMELQIEAARQKNVWLDKYFPTANRVMVEHKGLKKRFATPNSILVDDTHQNIFDFNECHGYGFLYDDTKLEENKSKMQFLLRRIIDVSSIGVYRV